LFSVNGVDFSTQSNTNLNDVIYGVSLNLASDAESSDGPRTATIEVKEDTAAARTAIQTFIDRLNEVQSYISTKSAITKTGETTATREVLSNDLIFNDLRDRMFEMTMSASANGGAYSFLADIGISIDSNLSVSISDSDKLEKALTTHFEDTRALLGSVMTKFQSVLTNFTGAEGYMQGAIKSFDTEKVDLDISISDFEKRLTVRKDVLVDQYAQMQATLIGLSYQQQMMNSLYSSLSLLT
jgi:flagellar capping protein FliD